MLAILPGQAAQAQSTAEPAVVSSNQQKTAEYTLPPDKLAKSKTLYELYLKLRILETAWGFLILLGILGFGVAARYRDWAVSASGNSFVQALIVVPILLLTIDLLQFPFSIYGHHISLEYGFSVQGWGSWLADQGKSELIAWIVGTILLWLMVVVIRKSPRRWWLYFWLSALPILGLIAYAEPLIIEPLFFQFQPLEKNHPELVTSIEQVVHRGGLEIPRERMFEMDASSKYTTLNAYVTGFGASKRVVVWDTAIQKLSTPELLFTFGHEMGHYVLNHVLHGLLLGAAGLLLALWIIYHVCRRIVPRLGPRWAFHDLGDWAALPLIFLLIGILSLVTEPVQNTISRHMEHQADVYGLEVTHGINPDSQQAAAHAFQLLGETSLDYPYPGKFVVFWFYDHPAISDRVRFAHEYDPWSKGQKPEFVP